MRQVTSRACVKINVPRFIEDYYGASKSGDIEDCIELRERFYRTFNNLDAGIQSWMRSYISAYLKKNRIDDRKDLGGIFKDLDLSLI